MVFVGQRRACGHGVLNFFTSDATARTWIAGHPGMPGRIVGQAQAEQTAAQTFGPLPAP